MNMNLSKLQYLNMLAEECNVTKAAKRLYISQPTLTTFLNNLEKDLGFHLFDRSSNPIKITKEGKAYIQKMKILLLEEQQLIERLQKTHLQKMNSESESVKSIHKYISRTSYLPFLSSTHF